MQENLDVSSFLETTERNFAMVKEVAALNTGGSEGGDIFSLMACKVGAVRMWWEAINVATVGSFEAAPGDALGDFSMEYLDDDWLKDILGA